MGKMHLQDSIDNNSDTGQKMQTERPTQQEPETKVPKPPKPPKPQLTNTTQQTERQANIFKESAQDFKNTKKEVIQMEDGEGIIIDLGDNISLNVPIKKRMSLQEFLRVAEKVKALEMLSDENQRY